MLSRKGARKAADIPAVVIELLHKGQLESVNLTEWLAVDHAILLQNVLVESGLEGAAERIIGRLNEQAETSVMKLIPVIAKELLLVLKEQPDGAGSRIFSELANHRSDSVRCWAAYMIGENDRLTAIEKLEKIRPFAADLHFGVREIAWMALRETVINNLTECLALLLAWVADENANVRRFAIELTRPRGVWAKHIAVLKENPALGLPLLEPVKSDAVKYVQDSVSNWLNDASKSNPEWVIRTCAQWLEVSDTKDTKRIVTRAKRSLGK
ncbi:DNA alkylation repair protein [Paenibacillus sp. J5C_2022]|uniref:DNA alkylation repair protein n=1 Tax=Paenibacillus sp. J5C2022 TaxID=2977129 RepID=UPI0021CEA797|nr:DNA alkylation repair protein [Paenibacillus sp. J5C2022]MCU6709990.1 DNA alkylation repair protein [Paenibacillus sp. J5C2022]